MLDILGSLLEQLNQWPGETSLEAVRSSEWSLRVRAGTVVRRALDPP